jgi:glycosyltransferase involved in cell wall biosynthesis
LKSIQVIKSLNRGGAEALLYSFFKYFGGKNHKLCVLSGNHLDMLDDFRELGIEPIIFKVFDKRFSFREYFRFLKFVGLHKDDYVFHSHLPLAGITIRSAKFIFGIRSLYTEHNVIGMYHPVTYFLNCATYIMEKRIVACSYLVGSSIPRLFSNRVVTVQNGVDVNRFPFVDCIEKWNSLSSKGEIRIICIAGFRDEKNHLLLLNIIRKLVLKDVTVRLKLIGDGTKRKDLENYVLVNKLEDFVFFEGIQSDVYPYLRWANFFCLTSVYEGLPISLLESMSAGCIPICSNVGGISEVYTNDFFPLISLTKNLEIDTNSFVNSILSMLSVPTQILFEKSKYASSLIQNTFSVDLMMKRLVEVYEEIDD